MPINLHNPLPKDQAAPQDARLHLCHSKHTPGPTCTTQFPSTAGDPKGDIGRQLPSLEEEFRRVKLEQAIDAELERLARRKGSQQGGGSS